jgi:hypothetical protein
VSAAAGVTETAWATGTTHSAVPTSAPRRNASRRVRPVGTLAGSALLVGSLRGVPPPGSSMLAIPPPPSPVPVGTPSGGLIVARFCGIVTPSGEIEGSLMAMART